MINGYKINDYLFCSICSCKIVCFIYDLYKMNSNFRMNDFLNF